MMRGISSAAARSPGSVGAIRRATPARVGSAVLGAACSAYFSALLLTLTAVEGLPWFVPLLLISFGVLGVWKPGAGLCALAAGVPIASWTGRTWNGAVAWPEAIVVAFAAGYAARSLRGTPHHADSLQTPIWIFAALVISSLGERLLVLHATVGPEALASQLRALFAGSYFVAPGLLPELDATMRLLEGLVLLRAASTTAHRHTAFAPRLARWFVAGAAAAALLNLWRIWQGAVRLDDPLPVFFDYLTRLRYNVHYRDVNAAGSYFVMSALVATGLSLATKRARWIPVVLLIASSLVLSGSRAALAAGGISALFWGIWQLKDRIQGAPARAGMRRLAVVVLAACAVAALVYVGTRRNLTPTSTALQIRIEFARTTSRMIAAYPAFGVGIGQYPERSGTFSSPLLVEGFGLRRENAHNNFLQILGELGIFGFAALLWVLWAAARRIAPLLYSGGDALANGVVAGLVAFVLTWLSGHPLLIDEPALLFWLLLGTAAGWSGADRPQHVGESRLLRGPFGDRARLAAAAIVVLALAITVPLRAQRKIADADLEHQGIGLSSWYLTEDGVRYRLAGASATVFVPSSAAAIKVALRASPPATELSVGVYLNGRPANLLRVPGDRWEHLHLILPADPRAPRFSRLEFQVTATPAPEKALLMVGRVEAQ